MNPPDKALVFSFDEKSQIQALDRTQLQLPLRPGIPARQTHDYKRNGTTTLFAALNILDGTIVSDCMPRHRHQEFLEFLNKLDRETPAHLELHLILDNYATHKHQKVQSWLKRHKRFHFHFTPTSSSWLNLIERWFKEITDKQIRRGTFQNVDQLIATIEDFIANHNDHPTKFIWSAPAERILQKIAKLKEVYETLH
jgi:transposase